jgi:hypothetical protein
LRIGNLFSTVFTIFGLDADTIPAKGGGMAGERMEKIKVVQRHGILGGGFWFASWLFTIGFLHLGFWRGVLALVIWPYYIGAWVRGLVR